MRVSEGAMKSDEKKTFRRSHREGVTEDAEIQQRSACGDNGSTEEIGPLSRFRRVRDESRRLCCHETYLLNIIYEDGNTCPLTSCLFLIFHFQVSL